jgi:hypothetical protein
MRRAALLAVPLLAVLAVLAFAWRGAAAPAPAPGPTIVHVGVSDTERPFRGEDGAALVLDRRLEIAGEGFYGTAFGPFVRLELADGSVHEAVMVILESGRRLVAWPPPGLRGAATLIVSNPDGLDARHAIAL